MIALGRLEGWVKYGNSWLWTRNSLNGNMASEPLINHCSFRLDISPTDFLKLEVWYDSSGITRLFVQNSNFTDGKIRFPYWSLYRFFKCFFSVLFSSFFLLHENYSSPFFCIYLHWISSWTSLHWILIQLLYFVIIQLIVGPKIHTTLKTNAKYYHHQESSLCVINLYCFRWKPLTYFRHSFFLTEDGFKAGDERWHVQFTHFHPMFHFYTEAHSITSHIHRWHLYKPPNILFFIRITNSSWASPFLAILFNSAFNYPNEILNIN